MWKDLLILLELKNISPLSCEILSSSFLLGLQLRRFANLCEQELNQLVEQRHPETNQNSNKLVSINLSRLGMHSENFRQNCFQRYGDNKIQRKLPLRIFLALKAI